VSEFSRFYLFSAKVEAWHDQELMTERKFRERGGNYDSSSSSITFLNSDQLVVETEALNRP
jgi:hypothetical protein